MAKIKLEYQTSLSVSEIKKRAKKAMKDVLKEFRGCISDIWQEWQGNTLFFSGRIIGFSISGKTIIENNLITVELRFSFLASAFKNKIRKEFYQRAKELFPQSKN